MLRDAGEENYSTRLGLVGRFGRGLGCEEKGWSLGSLVISAQGCYKLPQLFLQFPDSLIIQDQN